ncbi:MAG: DegT/DnrJ/EryC1/StrS family aminotransferase [Elusimicrobia bacterium]|nr:DegT/DnrJ/EryC1/StrS family aminotransferase [Elusimicrobiota bacterium]
MTRRPSPRRSPIAVTMPFRPPLEEYVAYLEKVWASGIMTHHGPLVQELESGIAKALKVRDVACLVNGTLAIQLALRALRLKGEVITTPFSYAATPAAIAYEGLKPVFADIDPETLNIDPARIEGKITERTCAIVPVHVFSCPCDTDRIQEIADRHGIKVVYDAAHAFAVDWKGRSVMSYGDVSAFSLHATKLINCGEGGGCVGRDPEVMARIRRLRFFGHDEDKRVVDEGTNAKMHELTAALGLVNLKYLGKVLENRRRKYGLYQELLKGTPSLRFQRFAPKSYNYSYMPVIFETHELMRRAERAMSRQEVFARRYFHPSLNLTKPYFQPGLPVSESIAERVLCLPLYDALPEADIERICSIIRKI